MLAALVVRPEGASVRSLADHTALAYSVVQREVDRLEAAGLVTSARVHAARVVRPNEQHPLFPELRALLLKAYGPVELMRDVLARESGVRDAFLFGSWAARYRGDWGDPPADVDVLVVGSLAPRRLEEIERESEERLGQPVQLTVVPPDDWDSEDSAFIRTVKQRPLVPVVGDGV